MKKKRFSVEQTVAVLEQAEVGVPVAEVIRKVGISEQTFYRWKKQYVGMETEQARQLKQLQDENSRLKQLVADLSLDKTMLQDVLRKSSETFGAASDGRSFTRQVSGERAACLPGSADGAGHVLLSVSSRTMDGVTDADTRDRTEQSALRVSQDPRAVKPRRLECWKISGISAVQGRGPGLEEKATAQEEGSTAPGRTLHRDGSEPGMEYRFRRRSVAGWHALPGVDDRRCVYTGERRDRSRPEAERRGRGARTKPSKTATWGA